MPRQVHGKKFIKEPSKTVAEELLEMSRKQLRIIIGLWTGHLPVKKHLNKIGMYNGDLRCRQCNKDTETVLHILCQCEAFDHGRQNIYGNQIWIHKTTTNNQARTYTSWFTAQGPYHYALDIRYKLSFPCLGNIRKYTCSVTMGLFLQQQPTVSNRRTLAQLEICVSAEQISNSDLEIVILVLKYVQIVQTTKDLLFEPPRTPMFKLKLFLQT
ncbi:hypothetical protein NQ317_017833 [Molorchus minor]|uniref:Reverse transcriptase zinc-binding domain-containing protein n=1 Tax=Molorchus minor TaxID=1323400 RepID=A0ABQ9J861_9CUCU|nr:hypothetical protein NQ317_017833 [Molorchus minor]